MTGASRAQREQQQAGKLADEVMMLTDELEALENELQDVIAQLPIPTATDQLETIQVKAKSSDVEVLVFGLLWQAG
jgi:prefoldin subunit 5